MKKLTILLDCEEELCGDCILQELNYDNDKMECSYFDEIVSKDPFHPETIKRCKECLEAAEEATDDDLFQKVEVVMVNIRDNIDEDEILGEIVEYVGKHQGCDSVDLAEALEIPLPLAMKLGKQLIDEGKLKSRFEEWHRE